MPVSMYDASVPAFAKMLQHLIKILDRAEAHELAGGRAPEGLLTLRIHPTMWDLRKQVSVASDFPVQACARLAGIVPPEVAVAEEDFNGLRSRVAMALGFVRTIPSSAFLNSETREVEYVRGDQTHRALGKDYLFDFVLPNFYFHLTVVYAILRQHGVPLVKEDFGRGFSF